MILLILGFVLSGSTGAQDRPLQSIVNAALKEASESQYVPENLLRAVCTVESNLNPKAINKYDGDSPSYGLCQIKLETAQFLHFRGSVRRLLNPYVNALFAAKYLRYQLDRYNGDWVRAISAYNAGSALSHRITNKKYVRKVLTHLES